MNNLSLYRKYRPKIFKEVVGQKYIVQIIQNALKLGRVSHAYLFVGERGTGKTTIARLLAKSLNCLDNKNLGEPCNKCLVCKEMDKNNLVDLIEIDAASNRGIDEIREIKEGARFTPTRTKYKVFIIDEVHMLTKEAFNALLKILEEPPQYVVFILATTEPEKLPNTIISRVQRFDFKRIGIKEITERIIKLAEMEKAKISPETAKEIALMSEGSLRDAESTLDQLLSLGCKEIDLKLLEEVLGRVNFSIILKFISYLLEGEAKKSIELIIKVQEQGANILEFSRSVLTNLRKIAIIKLSSETESLFLDELTPENLKELKLLANKFEWERLRNLLDEFIKIKEVIRHSPIPTLPIEIIALEYQKRSDN